MTILALGKYLVGIFHTVGIFPSTHRSALEPSPSSRKAALSFVPRGCITMRVVYIYGRDSCHSSSTWPCACRLLLLWFCSLVLTIATPHTPQHSTAYSYCSTRRTAEPRPTIRRKAHATAREKALLIPQPTTVLL